MAHRFVRSPQRERIWQVDIQFSRFKKETAQQLLGTQNQNAPHRGKNTLHYTRHFSAIYKRGKGIYLQIVYIWRAYGVEIQNLKYKAAWPFALQIF